MKLACNSHGIQKIAKSEINRPIWTQPTSKSKFREDEDSGEDRIGIDSITNSLSPTCGSNVSKCENTHPQPQAGMKISKVLRHTPEAVSYTHLTLPTILLV